MTRYAAMRTDTDQQPYLWEELQAGRMRQGWGWLPEQDLRQVRKRRQAGEQLTQPEKVAWRNRRLLDDVPDGLQEWDVVLVPHVARHGTWVLVELTSGYKYDAQTDGDYRHLRHARLIKHPQHDNHLVNPSHPYVPADLRRSMTCRSRMWSLDHLAEDIAKIADALKRGEDLSTGAGPDERFDNFAKSVRDSMAAEVRRSYAAAELEDLVARVLEAIYPDATVSRTGGPNEQGIDALVEITDPLGFEARIGVQVKSHSDTEWSTRSLEQIETAAAAHEITAGVVISTAESMTDDYRRRREQTEKDRGIPVRVILRDEFLDLVLGVLGARGLGPG